MLSKIKAKLPKGWNVTNKDVIIKKVQKVGSSHIEERPTSWVENTQTGEKSLVMLKSDGNIKFLASGKYLVNGKEIR